MNEIKIKEAPAPEWMWEVGVEGDLFRPHLYEYHCEIACCQPMETGNENLSRDCPVTSGYAWAVWEDMEFAHIVEIEERRAKDRPDNPIAVWIPPWKTICRGADIYSSRIHLFMSRADVPLTRICCSECLARHP